MLARALRYDLVLLHRQRKGQREDTVRTSGRTFLSPWARARDGHAVIDFAVGCLA
jgi:hypothetical protein